MRQTKKVTGKVTLRICLQNSKSIAAKIKKSRNKKLIPHLEVIHI